MPNVLELISDKDRLDFSQNYDITNKGYVGDALFPDRKTESLEAEYEMLTNGMHLPTAAKVHALDTEAAIGERAAITKVTVEKLLIKEKINQSERLTYLLNHGVRESNLIGYVFDDMRRLADNVKVRTEIAKMDVLSKGNMVINENNVNMTINFGIAAPTSLTGWNDPTHDIIGDIETLCAAARAKGYKVNRAITSDKMMSYIRKNTAINKIVYHTESASGMIASKSQIDTLMSDLFGITVIVNDDTYGVANSTNTVRTATRFFDEDVFTVFAATGTSIGVGLWGVTPEEEKTGPFTAKSAQQYVTISQWETPDPVATWTKASGLFIPVVPMPDSIIIGTHTASTGA